MGIAGFTSRRLTLWVVAALVAAVAAALAVMAAQPAASSAQSTCTKPQKLGVVFVVDDSGSMTSNDPDKLAGTAVGIALDQLPDGSLTGVTQFSSDATTLIPPTEVNGASRQAIKTELAAKLKQSGGTDFVDAFTNAKTLLDGLTTADRKAIVFLTDGQATQPTDQQLQGLGAPVYVVGFGQSDGDVLKAIANVTGGTFTQAASAGDLQGVFGRTVASLTCDQQSLTTNVVLQKGESKDIPFDVKNGDGSFRALATWGTGKVDVKVIRPDASELTPASVKPTELFTLQPTYALIEGTLPPPGTWNVRLTADPANLAAVNVSIDVWRRALAIRRASAIQVFCNRAAQSGVAAPCTATVADAEKTKPDRQTPTGTVTFAATRGTPAAASCQLVPTPLSPGVASCKVNYTPSSKDGIGVAFPVSMTYEGDGVFNGVTGVHKLINAACIDTAFSKCTDGVSVDLLGNGVLNGSNVSLSVKCGKTASSNPGDACGVAVGIAADTSDAATPSLVPPTASAAANKKKKKSKAKKKNRQIVKAQTLTLAAGKKKTLKLKLNKYGTTYKKSAKKAKGKKYKTLPVVVYVSVKVANASKPVVVKKKIKLRIK